MEADSKTILVVDDDCDLLAMVASLLKEEGYQVLTALNGREGLDVVERHMPDLIILDMKMPVLDGPGFAREFHARFGSRVPILVYTASEDPRKEARELGAVAGVEKSFDLDALVAAVACHTA